MKAWIMFKTFFINYFWIGIMLIFFSILIGKDIDATSTYLILLTKLFETVGIAIVVASLFSFTFESMSFQDKMQDIVENIVLKRTFLSNLANEKKKEALHSLLQPTEQEIKIYSNIEDYYNYYIDETLNVSKKNVRSNYNINVKAKYDETTSRVYTEGIYSYRLYPSDNGYTNITVGFLKDDKDSTVDVIVNLPDGERKKFKNKDLTFKEDDIARETEIEINELYKEHDHLDIELRVTEYGFNHWMNIFFKAEQATDGFKFTLYCDDDITIKTHNVFDVGHKYHIDLNDNKNEIHIGCHQWINEGAGILIIASKKEI